MRIFISFVASIILLFGVFSTTYYLNAESYPAKPGYMFVDSHGGSTEYGIRVYLFLTFDSQGYLTHADYYCDGDMRYICVSITAGGQLVTFGASGPGEPNICGTVSLVEN